MKREKTTGAAALLGHLAVFAVLGFIGCDDAKCPSPTMEVRGHCLAANAQTAAGDAVPQETGGEQSSSGTGGTTSAAASASSAGSPGTGGSTASHQGSGGSSQQSSEAGENVAGSGGMSTRASTDNPAGGGGSSGSDGGGSASNGSSPISVSAGQCVDGRTPSEETCDSEDNDCDGRIDEQIVARACGPMKVGVCRPGSQACDAGTWTACQGAVEASAEVCDADGVDEDCNGVANDGCACVAGETKTCGTDVGACVPGKSACVDGAFSTECMNSTKPSQEVCNSVDDDCDGVVDNTPRDCTGRTTRCSQGRCVQCTDSSQCPPAGECTASSCTASGDCASTPKAAKAVCAAGVCDGTGKCVACLDASDCKNPDPVCESNRCMTKPHCGNGKLDPGENCEISDPLWANDTMSTCDRAQCYLTDSIYHQCASIGAACWTGSVWFCGPTQVCSVACINDDQCKTTTHSNARCLQINASPTDPTRTCAIPCSSDSGCPNGLTCVQAGNPVVSVCGHVPWVAPPPNN